MGAGRGSAIGWWCWSLANATTERWVCRFEPTQLREGGHPVAEAQLVFDGGACRGGGLLGEWL